MNTVIDKVETTFLTPSHVASAGYTKTAEAMKHVFASSAPAAPVDEPITETPIPPAPRTISESIPITLDDTTVDLIIYEGQGAEEAVVAFCQVGYTTI